MTQDQAATIVRLIWHRIVMTSFYSTPSVRIEGPIKFGWPDVQHKGTTKLEPVQVYSDLEDRST